MTRKNLVVRVSLPVHCTLARFGACAGLCETDVDRSLLLWTGDAVYA